MSIKYSNFKKNSKNPWSQRNKLCSDHEGATSTTITKSWEHLLETWKGACTLTTVETLEFANIPVSWPHFPILRRFILVTIIITICFKTLPVSDTLLYIYMLYPISSSQQFYGTYYSSISSINEATQNHRNYTNLSKWYSYKGHGRNLNPDVWSQFLHSYISPALRSLQSSVFWLLCILFDPHNCPSSLPCRFMSFPNTAEKSYMRVNKVICLLSTEEETQWNLEGASGQVPSSRVLEDTYFKPVTLKGRIKQV